MPTKPSVLETKHLVSLGAGMLMPIPVLGEAILAYGLYPVVKETKVFGHDPLLNQAVSLAAAALARIEFYKPFYLPILDQISKFF